MYYSPTGYRERDVMRVCVCVCRNDILQRELGQYRGNLKEVHVNKQIKKMEQEKELRRGFEDSDISPHHQKV